jgi:cobalamin biosynthesis protein CobD/CbiB
MSMPTILVSIIISLITVTVAVWGWRTMMADRQQIFDKKGIRHRWATASWGRRIATILAIPFGVAVALILIRAEESGPVPESVVQVIVILAMVFGVRSLAKQMRKEREQEERDRDH